MALVADTAAPGGPDRWRGLAELDDALAERGRAGSLWAVLVHPPGTERPLAASLPVPLASARTLHVRRAGPPGPGAHGGAAPLLGSDLGRAARVLSGRAQGLVLGGGGPRGFAHLGVLQALDDAHIPVDMVAGTSIGAIMSAARAMDLTAEDRRRRTLDAFVESGRLFPPTFPMLSFTSGRKIKLLLEEPQNFGTRTIEECWLPFFCVSANLTRAETVVHERGSLATAVRASMALPGILPPVPWGRDLLVDGGVLNNLPVDLMRARVGRGQVIAVDLTVPVEVEAPLGYRDTPSGWGLLWDRVRRAPRDLPLLPGVLMRAKELASIATQRELLASNPPDVVIRPDVADCPMFDFAAAADLIDIAYRQTMARLDDASLPLVRE